MNAPENKKRTVSRAAPGQMVYQPPSAVRLSRILHNAAIELNDIATDPDAAQMWEDARTVASRILAACEPRREEIE
jgi:hypothetical protein